MPAASTPRGIDTDGAVRRLPAGRKAEVAAYVAEVGEVTVAELAERFAVSADTVRRDLDELDANGALIRTHGGAISASGPARPDTGVDIRSRIQASAKDRIGQVAATLVDDGASILVNAGTTTLAVVDHLRDHRRLTIVTNNLRIPHQIAPTIARELYVFGGSVSLSAQATVGPVGMQRWVDGHEVDIECDLAFIGVGAVNAERGYMTSSLREAAMMREMMNRASKVVVVADSSKFGRRLFAKIADLGDAHCFVTDTKPPPELLSALERAGVEVLTAAEQAEGRAGEAE